MKYFLLGFIATWSNAAHAFESTPKFAKLKQGQKAPFEGRLFNDTAVSKLIVENRLMIEQCEIQIEYNKKKVLEREKYRYNLLTAKSESADERLNDLITIKQDEVDRLNKLAKPSKSSWWLAGGFAAGVGTSIAIMHAVK